MRFTIEDRHLPANIMTFKALHLAKKEDDRLTAEIARRINISFDFSQQYYQVQSATEMHVGHSRTPGTS